MLGLGAIGQFAIGEVGVGTGGGAEFIGPDKYMQRLSEPVRFKLGVKASSQQFLALHANPVVSFSWFETLSEPTRRKPRSPAALSPPFFYQPAPSPFVATGWYSPLSEPVRQKKGIHSNKQQFLTYQANPTTVTPFAWFASLSDPVRQKRGLAPRLQQFFATDPTVIPTATSLNGWFSWLSEPVRFKLALRVPLQQSYTGAPRLLPNPEIFGTLSALETKDTFLAGAMVWNRATDAEIGVINTTPQPAEISLYQTAPTAGTITVRISIIIG
jgi:hypothetical protein